MTADRQVRIGNHILGPGHPPYIVAELSANHHHSFERAAELVRLAKEAGADAVKLQTYTQDTLTIDHDSEPFVQPEGTPWAGRTLHDLYTEAHMPWEWQPELRRLALDAGLDLFSTPFDPTAVDFLEAMEVPAHKIASFEIVDLPLIRRVAGTGKPVVMSTGMATVDEIQEAVDAVRSTGNDQLVLLHCVSSYPAPLEDMNLRSIPFLAERFETPVGLSDHSLGTLAAAAAVALGACMIEKHMTLSRSEPGPDSAFSLEPDEFREMADTARSAASALGVPLPPPLASEAGSLLFRRSLFVVEDVPEAASLTPENVRSIRPANGLHPRHYDEILGRRTRRALPKGTPLRWEDLEPGPEPAGNGSEQQPGNGAERSGSEGD